MSDWRSRVRRHPGGKGQSRRGPRALEPSDTITLGHERRATGVDEILESFDRELVGLVPVKRKVAEIAALLLVDRARQSFGLEAPRPSLHMCFTGPPGTGKTTVALRMADLLCRLGYLDEPEVVHAMRDDLVGEYVGQTAPKTKRILDRAMGGVLFIDEAYYLYRASDSKDYGQEAIDILLQVMENDRDRLVVILAGYKDRMDEFFGSNPGMSSRIAHHLDFAAYELDELVAIGQMMLDEASYYLSDGAEAAFREHLMQQMARPRFANARSVRNELEGARLRHAFRLSAEPDRNWSLDDLMRIEPMDVLSDGFSSAEISGQLAALRAVPTAVADPAAAAGDHRPLELAAYTEMVPGRPRRGRAAACAPGGCYGQTRPLWLNAACVSGMTLAHWASIFSATISISRCGKDGNAESGRRVRRARKFISARALQVAYIDE
jgi:probable Rubsico expression protein CbbX